MTDQDSNGTARAPLGEQAGEESAVELVLNAPMRDLGDGFTVQRALPAPQRRTVGPFVFFDSMGPHRFPAGGGLDVRPHPHIGLATVTYLFEGEILHRDSLGNAQVIRPGEVNWMIAGRGIVHSERTPQRTRADSSSLAGLQIWIGLPQREEQMPPHFAHHGAAELPQLEHAGVHLRLIAGTLAGARSPVQTLSPMFYADAQLDPGATVELDDEHAERAIFVSQGSVRIDGQPLDTGRMVVLRPARRVRAHAEHGARLLLLGGAPLDGPRYVWWNLVSSSRERIQRAAEDWRAGRFDPVPEETEFIPLPDSPMPEPQPRPVSRPVNYP